MSKNNCLKVKLYILSLLVFFFLITCLTINIPISFQSDAVFIGWKKLLSANIVPMIFFVFIIYSFITYLNIKFIFKGTMNPSYNILEIKDKSFEPLTFLITYTIPLISIDISEAQNTIVLFILLIIIGILFIKTKLYLANPTLALLNYKLYEIEIEIDSIKNSILVISLDTLKKNNRVTWIELEQNIWYVKKEN